MTGKQAAISNVARNLRVAQAIARVSNTDLAMACGVSPRTVGKWRSGEVEITLGNLAVLAETLDKPLSWFVAQDETEEAA